MKPIMSGFNEYDKPVPAWSELEQLSDLILQELLKVIIVGEKGKIVRTI